MTTRIKSFAGSMFMSAMLIVFTAAAASAQVLIPRAPAATPAQSGFHSTAFLNTAFAAVLNGQREVWVTTSTGTRMKVRVTAVTPAGLRLIGTNGQGQTVPVRDITRIQLVSNRLRRNATVGFFVGAGLGAYGAAVCGQAMGNGCQPKIFFAYAGMGAGIGALVGVIKDAEHRDDDIVYDAATRTKTLALMPIVSRTRKGAALSVSWR